MALGNMQGGRSFSRSGFNIVFLERYFKFQVMQMRSSSRLSNTCSWSCWTLANFFNIYQPRPTTVYRQKMIPKTIKVIQTDSWYDRLKLVEDREQYCKEAAQICKICRGIVLMNKSTASICCLVKTQKESYCSFFVFHPLLVLVTSLAAIGKHALRVVNLYNSH